MKFMKKRNEQGLTEKEFLEQYNPKNYEKPSITTDIVVIRIKEDLSCLQVLLIQRKDHPYIDQWALPGGFMNIDETLEEAAKRELFEETGIDIDENNIEITQLPVMSNPNRDPRMRIVDVPYLVLIPNEYDIEIEVKANDDAKNALWFDISYNGTELKLTNKDIVIEYSIDGEINHNSRLLYLNMDEKLSGLLKSENSLAFDHIDILLNIIHIYEVTINDNIRDNVKKLFEPSFHYKGYNEGREEVNKVFNLLGW